MVKHLITLRHPSGDERSLNVQTESRGFSDVHREVSKRRTELQLFGYQIWEVIELTPAF